MDALKLLKNDHDQMKKLLKQVQETSDRAVKKRAELFDRVCEELTTHEAIEEEIFYPALKEHPKAREMVLEAYEEHNVVDNVMVEISEIPYEDESWAAKFKVMAENIEHHIEEEEGQLFDQARQVFGKQELDRLGVEMEQRKKEYQQAA